MQIRIKDFHFKTGSFPLVEIDIKKVQLTDIGEKITAVTEHTVSAVKIVDDVEVLEYLNRYNHPFDYQGGNPFLEALQSLNDYLADPAS